VKKLSFLSSSSEHLKTDWNSLAWPRVCGLLAENPSRYSATLHNAGFKARDLPFSYHGFSIEDVETPIHAMKEMGFRAYSVTIPFKQEVMKFIDSLGPAAKKIGAVNTIINDGSELHGFNTDWIGVANSFKEIRDTFTSDHCLILGAGGAARGAVYAMQKIGVKEITICNRTYKKSKELAQEFHAKSIQTSELSKDSLKDYSLIINTTPGERLPYFPYSCLTDQHTILDMVTAETPLTIQGREAGSRVILGIRMLLHQGIEQFRLFTELDPPALEMEEALLELYNKNQQKS